MSTIETNDVDIVIAKSALEIIKQSLRRESDIPDQGGQTFRVKNLTRGEISELLSRWDTYANGTYLESIRVVIAGDSDGDFPEKFRAEKDKTISFYRNSIKEDGWTGLVYVQTKVEDDQEGLKNIFTLRDSNFLDGSFDTDELPVPQRIFGESWKVAGGQESEVPELLSGRVQEALSHVHPKPAPVSARKFVRFCIAVSRARLANSGNMDPTELEAIVGRALIELDVFPDESWRLAPTRTARRLVQNSLHAELASSLTTDLDQEKLVEVCKKTVFKGKDDHELNESEQRRWRSKCISYCTAPIRDLRAEIPYAIFEQLFRKDVAGMPLGERVENEITAKSAARRTEFEALQVKTGLDRREAEEAQRFLDSESEQDDESALPDLLSRQTRRMVEKVASPNPERITNPFSKIAEIAEIFRGRSEHAEATIELRPGKGFDKASPTVGLFAFLFAATLKSVCESPPVGYALKVDSRLTQIRGVPPLVQQGEDLTGDDDVQELRWDSVPIEFHLVSNESGKELDVETNIEWLPNSHERLALLWLFLAADDAPKPEAILAIPSATTLEKWLLDIVGRLAPLTSCATETWPAEVCGSGIIDRLFQLTQALREAVTVDGIGAAALSDHFDSWSQVLAEAKTEFVPDGVPDERMSAFLSACCINTDAGGGCLMLPSHPFRLRWLASYLVESEVLAINGLAGDLHLNRQNERLYLDSFAARSPHQQPAISCTRDRRVLLAAGELGWSEQFVVAETEQSVAAVTDNSASDEIYGQIEAYLDAHPHRGDGLSILVALARDSSLPTQLVRTIRRGEWRQIAVTVHVVAPRALWDDIVADFESLPSDSRLSHGSNIFPPVQLRLHEFPTTEKTLSKLADEIQCDVAIAPQFLSNEISLQVHTEPNEPREGEFNVLLDEPTFVHGGLQGGAISVSTRPFNPDPELDMWSTLVVRHHRASPVSSQQPENTDYLELTVDFSQTARLFEALHDCAHWVITLERHLTREQIESLESSPDILTVRKGVGAGGLYTLIVSSNIGREFVIERLRRKLRRIVGASEEEVGQTIAERIYDATRQIAPRLALQATGISRVTEEILGLMIARQIAESRFPAAPEDGIVVWISLDDHPEWFRGTSAVRADLIRLTLEIVEQQLVVDVLVVEGKLRTAYDRHGIDQVEATLNLVRDFLPPSDALDAPQWRARVRTAIAGVSPEARRMFGPTAEAAGGNMYHLPLQMRTAFRDGDFTARRVEGLFAISRYDKDAELDITPEGDQGVFVARAYRDQILALVSGDVASSGVFSEPTSTEISPPAVPPPVESLGVAGVEADPTDAEREPAVPGQPVSPVAAVTLDVDTSSEAQAGQCATESGRLGAAELTKRYQTILEQFGAFNIDVQRAPDDDRFVEGPASVLYRLKPGAGVAPRHLSEKADTLKLALGLTEEQRIRFSIDRGYVNFDIPKDDKDRYFVDAEDIWARWSRPESALGAPLGEDRFGNVVDLNFSSPNSPHLLIGGTTGSGKSEALNTILQGLVEHYLPNELKLLLVDPKGTELECYSGTPHLDGKVGWDEQDALSILERAVNEMQARYKRFREVGVRSLSEFNDKVSESDRLPWWVVVLDEYADLTSDPDAKKKIEVFLKRLAQKARASGIHVIIATQKPSGDVISTNLRSNLPAQLALRVKSSTESRVVMDDTGAEALNGKGDAFLKAAGKLTRVQCARVRT